MISLTHNRIDPEDARRSVECAEVGGISVFIGVVRNNSDGKPTAYLEYSAYEPMALKQMDQIAREAASRWGANVAMIHRLGRLEVGEIAVVCAAGTPHRAEAFDCCRFLIDTLKNDVPIWKKEAGPDGAFWIEGSSAVRAEESRETHRSV